MPLAHMAAMPLANSVSPTGLIGSGPAARCIARACTNTVARTSWPVRMSASMSSSR
jgi:hypothetical protein